MKKPIAVILGLNFNGLGIIRCLGLMKVQTIGIYTYYYEVGKHSRYCYAIKFPPLSEKPELFLNNLVKLGIKLGGKSVLIPQNDMYVKFIYKNQLILQNNFLFNEMNEITIDKIIDKRKTVNIARENGLSVPKTYIPNKQNDLDNIINNNDNLFPIIIKPFNSFSIKMPKRHELINNEKVLNEYFYNNDYLFGNVVLQKFVGNGDGNIYQCHTYYSKRSKPILFFTVRKIRQSPKDFGVGSYIISEKNTSIINLTNKFLNKIEYKGVASIEYIYDHQTEKYYFIECNPRYPGQIIMCLDDGINIPYINYCELLGYNYSINKTHQLSKTIHLWFQKDLESLIQNKSNHSINNLYKWFKSLLNANSFIYFHEKDLIPFICSSYIYKTIIDWIWIITNKSKNYIFKN